MTVIGRELLERWFGTGGRNSEGTPAQRERAAANSRICHICKDFLEAEGCVWFCPSCRYEAKCYSSDLQNLKGEVFRGLYSDDEKRELDWKKGYRVAHYA